MAKQNMNATSITATESAESLVEETVPMVEQVESAASLETQEQVEQVKVDVKSMPTGAIIQAILSSTFAPDARLTGYKIHSVINVAFQILQIEDPKKAGTILTITPQMIYNATKLRTGETFDMIRTLEFVTRYVQRRRDGQVAGVRVAEATLMANALKALS